MNRPSVRELECFVAVAEELSFSRAAVRMHLSQPPLSRQVRSLEERLGCRLFERDTRKVTLTPAGEKLLQEVRPWLGGLDRMVDEVKRFAAGETTRLRLGFVGALLDEDLAGVLAKFREGRPNCQVQLEDLSPADQELALQEGRIDGALIGERPAKLSQEWVSFTWKREPLVVVLPKGHRWEDEPSLKLAQLREERWVMVAREGAPAFRRQFDEWCRQAGFGPQIVHESKRVAAVLTWVAANQGISLVPSGLTRMLDAAVVFLPLVGKPRPVLAHGFVYRRTAKNPALREWVKLLRGFSMEPP
ncbi:DNA-binding transcriptional LysR family regulator [Haloferula luteola]|uniref:DNA-binding transcriptional LysR family regulator n=1 Tax=Haloferula luteola TaxID=595692 RepID=A0A840VCE5_9BACT|nr:LysR substrate-binding domain-containing protein [Haloferula luteola]MBB5351590.1 DNA-binding transcriptional LysR family regulator [Haloferula luteola]